MPRQAIAPAEITGTDLVKQSPPDVMGEAAQLADAKAQLDTFFIKQPFTVEHRVTLYLAAAQQCGVSLLTMGACLCDLKDHITEGEWLQTLEQLGITARTAQRQMQIWRTFGKENRLPFAVGKRANLLLEFSRLDDATLDSALESGELDELDRLPIAELKKRVKELQSALETSNEIVQAKDQKINELDRRARAWSRTAPTARAIEILRDAASIERQIRVALTDFQKAVKTAIEQFHGDDPEPEVKQEINRLLDLLDDLPSELSVLRQY